MNKALYLVFLIFLCGCAKEHAATEKFQKKRENSIDVRSKIHCFDIDSVLVSGFARIYLIDNYMIVSDNRPVENGRMIHLLDKRMFRYITSCTRKGEGPAEIANLGWICTDEMHRKFYVTDSGKQNIRCYNLDSALLNPNYIAPTCIQTNKLRFPKSYFYRNDSSYIAQIVEVLNKKPGFNLAVASWNMENGEIGPSGYENPEVKKVRFFLDVSLKYQRYVKSYSHHDLLTICDLDGNLMFNVYGPEWSSEITNTVYYNMDIQFCGEQIFALYSGKDHRTDDYYPSKIHIFNLDGDYIKTLDLGYRVHDFCYDHENNRIILILDSEYQFGFLELKDVETMKSA